jgi:predicted enzyme related to lactoylglutathione lyase
MFSDTSGRWRLHDLTPEGQVPEVYITVDSADAARGRREGRQRRQSACTLISEEIGYWAMIVDPAGNEVGLFEKTRA